MHRTTNAFSVLQATAATLGLAILLWSVGLPSLRFAEAANVTDFSDTLSDSSPSADSDHTIEFVSLNGVASGQTIVLTFDTDTQAFDLTGIGEEDVDLLENGVAESVGTDWLVTVNTTADTITLTSQGAGGVIAGGATTTILVGTHATNDGSPNTQIGNPSADSYEISVSAGATDSGSTRVAIVDTVEVTASVDTLFTFAVGGLAGGTNVNGDTTTGPTSTTSIPFGELIADTASTAAQSLSVITNARNGFVITVQTDQQLTSANGADIDSFDNGNNQTSPIPWDTPNNTPGSEETYGHWGLTSNDSDYFGASEYVAASTTPVEVFANDGPSDGSGVGDGIVYVGYTVEIGSLQEAAEDYTATLTYVATPVF